MLSNDTTAASLCQICAHNITHHVTPLSLLKRVTSDAKPWPTGGNLSICEVCGTIQKPLTNKLLEEIELIYSDYEPYYQSQGNEQAVFSENGAAEKRSAALSRFIDNTHYFQHHGTTVLDYGCATGEFLQAFSKQFPNWELNGLDLSRKHESRLQAIDGFHELYSSHSCPKNHFDLIALIHTLEHLTHPVETLIEIKQYLKPNGALFIQVPNILKSPFDILIADHILHFSSTTLITLLHKAGFQLIELSTDVVSKEISLLVKPAASVQRLPPPTPLAHLAKLVNRYLDFASKLVEQSQRLSAQTEVGIFGTSISGTWLFSYLPNTRFFVDEDPSRIGQRHFNKPIRSPIDIIGSQAHILMPLAPFIATQITKRYAKLERNLILPPALVEEMA